ASPPPSAAAITDNLQRYLRARLPAYMVPGRFVMLPALPLTPNGKLDRRALPAPDAVRADHRPPVTAIEQTIAELWRSALGVDAIGLDDDFFALGGSSLVAMQLMARLQETFGVELSLGQLFGALTPGAQATLITQLQATTIATVPVTTIQRIVREPGALDTTTDALADLSDASVDAMLQRLLAGRGDGTAG
ncbi:MAG: hypothetical protein KIT73_09950, partial [Burkholderiales bacterium]|nr:hypothetical protein [Burkholderiales bacterium]